MNNIINRLVILNGYPLAVVVALAMHVLLLLGLIYLQGSNRVEALELVQPTVIKALFIDENPQVRNQRQLEQQRIQRQEDQRRAAEEAARREREVAERRAAEEAAREEARRQAALLEREELERQQQLAREREQQQERERQQQQEAERRRQQELAEAERQRQAERARQQQADAATAEGARNEFELVQSATGLIQQFVEENWSRPPSARNGMRAVLRIQMLPTGELLDATIIESSGDPAFDRSAENAVYRAAPFTELRDLPINVFNQNFRTLSLIFEPTDLLN